MGRAIPQSTFQKLAMAFLGLGVVPLTLMFLLFLRNFESNFTRSLESTMEEANYYAQSKVDDLFTGIDRAMDCLYDSNAAYGTLCDLLESGEYSRNERQLYVGLMLDRFLSDPAVSAAHFISVGGERYSRFYSQQKTAQTNPDSRHVLTPRPDALRALAVLPAAGEEEWCSGSDDRVISLSRNYMDPRSMSAITGTALGTLYVDVYTDSLDALFDSLRLGAGGNVAILDETGEVLYQLRMETGVPALSAETELFSDDDERYTVFCQSIGQSDYRLLVSFDRRELSSAYTSSRAFLVLMLGVSLALVLGLSLSLSGHISDPARKLKKAMQEVEQGDLSARVDIRSGDEMEYLGEGFNRMVEKLDETIQEVYVAQICQRDAELNALKMQIQPHYLYNTLDVIRMSALDQGDEKTARLIESLSHQLRYVMGDHRERVTLRQELDSLREYAVIITARYEGRIAVNIEAEDRDLELLVPKLLLQPFVENAIKHGLRERPEGGSVLIEVTRRSDILQIVVLNDGAPISAARLEHIRRFLSDAAIGEQDGDGVVSVGMKNTYDRIKLDCGPEYGFTMDSDGDVGVIVTIRLPIWREGEHRVESTAGG